MSYNKQQTAVEWLFNNLKSHFEHDGDLLEVVQMSFNQAKEIEKEQIMNAHIESGARLGDISIESAEQYYNETFGGNNESNPRI